MVIDSSALLAILFQEPERETFAAAVEAAQTRLISAVTALEAAAAIIVRKGPAGGRELDLFLHEAQVETVAFTADHYRLARDAWLRFGRRRHAAALNFGDCCAYATARLAEEPLLFKGEDFTKTDIESAMDVEHE